MGAEMLQFAQDYWWAFLLAAIGIIIKILGTLDSVSGGLDVLARLTGQSHKTQPVKLEYSKVELTANHDFTGKITSIRPSITFDNGNAFNIRLLSVEWRVTFDGHYVEASGESVGRADIGAGTREATTDGPNVAIKPTTKSIIRGRVECTVTYARVLKDGKIGRKNTAAINGNIDLHLNGKDSATHWKYDEESGPPVMQTQGLTEFQNAEGGYEYFGGGLRPGNWKSK